MCVYSYFLFFLLSAFRLTTTTYVPTLPPKSLSPSRRPATARARTAFSGGNFSRSGGLRAGAAALRALRTQTDGFAAAALAECLDGALTAHDGDGIGASYDGTGSTGTGTGSTDVGLTSAGAGAVVGLDYRSADELWQLADAADADAAAAAARPLALGLGVAAAMERERERAREREAREARRGQRSVRGGGGAAWRHALARSNGGSTGGVGGAAEADAEEADVEFNGTLATRYMGPTPACVHRESPPRQWQRPGTAPEHAHAHAHVHARRAAKATAVPATAAATAPAASAGDSEPDARATAAHADADADVDAAAAPPVMTTAALAASVAAEASALAAAALSEAALADAALRTSTGSGSGNGYGNGHGSGNAPALGLGLGGFVRTLDGRIVHASGRAGAARAHMSARGAARALEHAVAAAQREARVARAATWAPSAAQTRLLRTPHAVPMRVDRPSDRYPSAAQTAADGDGDRGSGSGSGGAFAAGPRTATVRFAESPHGRLGWGSSHSGSARLSGSGSGTGAGAGGGPGARHAGWVVGQLPAGDRIADRLAALPRDADDGDTRQRQRAQSALVRRLYKTEPLPPPLAPRAPVDWALPSARADNTGFSRSGTAAAAPMTAVYPVAETGPAGEDAAAAEAEALVPRRRSELRALAEAAGRERLHEHLVRHGDAEPHRALQDAITGGGRAQHRQGQGQSQRLRQRSARGGRPAAAMSAELDDDYGLF